MMMMMLDSRGGGSGGGGCCVARYESEKMDRIMLRFRPIAPRPSAGGSSTGNTSSGGGDTYVKIGRGKRRYRNSNSNNNTDQKTSSAKRRKTTLPLPPLEVNEMNLKGSAPIWLNFNSGAAEKDEVDHTVEKDNNHHRPIHYTPDSAVIIPARGACGTCVTLECLTYTMVNVDALGRTDNERMMNLERDTCPGFVSDRLSRIKWSNAAFRKMVGVDHNIVSGWVAMKESVGVGVSASAFSCRVRVQVEDNKTRKSKTMTVPCDVWLMDCGGFAWRLDVRAALTLAL